MNRGGAGICAVVLAGGRGTRLEQMADEGAALPDGIRIGVHPDEERARFTVTADGVALVTAPMLDS